MKKLLIASAALAMVAGTAQAQSNVSIYGTVDVGYGQTKTTVSGDVTGSGSLNGDRKTSTTGNGDGGLSTSILGFRGTEDLGGGKSAVFTLEYDLIDVGAGSTITGSRQAFVGLADAKLGTLRLGRMASASHGNIVAFSAGMANNTVGAIYSAGSEPTSTVSPNMLSIRPHVVFPTQVIGYTSPNMGGVVLNAQYGQVKADTVSTTDTNAKTTFTDIAAKFDSGKLSLGASYQELKTTANSFTAATADTAAGVGGTIMSSTIYVADSGANSNLRQNASYGAGTVKVKTTMFGASYNFGVVQPFALYTEKKIGSAFTSGGATGTNISNVSADDATGGMKQKAYELGARVPVSATVMAFASMYDGDIKSADGEGKNDLSGYQVGATYAMSKRTTVYAITGQQKNKSATEGETFQAKATGTSVGLRHTF